MSDTREDPVDLALAEDFRLGNLLVSPSTREARRGDLRETMEPRVMQVLVALYQARGTVVSRDELINRCWEGRVVGEDAINRAIGRLRRLSEADGGASFTVETIPRVGYRLVAKELPAVEKHAATDMPAAPGEMVPSLKALVSRRVWLWGAGAAGCAVAAALGWRVLDPPSPPSSDPAAAQIERGLQMLRDASPGSVSEGVGTFKAVVARFPQNAQAWGWLAVGYALLSHNERQSGQSMRLQAAAAADRALYLDPHNAQAFEARGWIPPRRGAWQEAERNFRQGLKYHPDYDGLHLGLAMRLVDVGRMREAANEVRQALDLAPQFDSALAWNSISIFWAANRLTEADHVAEQALQQFPRNVPTWFWRVYLLMLTGRAEQALVLLNDADNRPPGIPQSNFAIEIAAAKALASGAAPDKAAAQRIISDSARQGSGYAENAIMMLCALGFIDDAFAVAGALYFGKGYQVGRYRFSDIQGELNPGGDERTAPLFSPSAQAMRQDRRFATLVADLGLAKYWNDSGSPPDYQR